MSRPARLPPDATRLYGYVVQLPGPVPVAEVGKAVRLDDGDFETALRALVDFELVEGRRGRVHARGPENALVRLVGGQQDSLADLLATLPELNKAYHHGPAADGEPPLTEKLVGRETMVRGLNRLIGSATESIQVFEKPPFGRSNPVEDAEQSTLERGIATQVVYESSVLELPDHMANMEVMAGLGEEARIRRSLPFKLLLVDRSEAIIPLGGAGLAPQSAVLVRSSVLTDALDALFDAVWESSISAGAADAASVDLTDAERELLRLLATGIKDEAIARRLDVSIRTVSRRVNSLLSRMGCTNRFQAGMAAAQRGWI